MVTSLRWEGKAERTRRALSSVNRNNDQHSRRYYPRGCVADVLKQLTKAHYPGETFAVQKMRVELHGDNARPHTARVVTEFLQRRRIEVVPHPPYSPDLAPNVVMDTFVTFR